MLCGRRLGLLSDDRRRGRLIGPAYVALGPRVVVEVAVARAHVLRRAKTRQAQLRSRWKHLAAVASSPVAVPVERKVIFVDSYCANRVVGFTCLFVSVTCGGERGSG